MFSLTTWSLLTILLGSTLPLAFIRVAEAQTSNIPACAEGCFQSAASALSCSTNDTTCLCQSPSFISSVLQCSGLECTPQDQATATSALGNMCNTDTTTSDPLGTSTGTSSFPISTLTSSLTSIPVITFTTTLPGGAGTTVTVPIFSHTPSPPISILSPPITTRTETSTTTAVSGSSSLGTSLGSGGTTSVNETTSNSVTTSLETNSTAATTSIPVTTSFETSTSTTGVPTAPPASSTSNGASSMVGSALGIGLSLFGAWMMTVTV